MTDDRTELQHHHRPLSNDLVLGSERILADLVAAQRDRVRRRRSRRAQFSAALLFLVAFVALRSMPATSRSAPPLPPTPNPSSIEIVQSAPRPITVEYLTDDDVVAELRAAGINAGLVRTTERVMIVGR